jgi:hypothetical protein
MSLVSLNKVKEQIEKGDQTEVIVSFWGITIAWDEILPPVWIRYTNANPTRMPLINIKCQSPMGIPDRQKAIL